MEKPNKTDNKIKKEFLGIYTIFGNALSIWYLISKEKIVRLVLTIEERGWPSFYI